MLTSRKKGIVLAVVMGLLALLMHRLPGRVIRAELLLSLLWLAPPFALWLITRKKAGKVKEGLAPSRLAPLIVLSVFLFLYLVSSGVAHRWFFFIGWLPGSTVVDYLSSGYVRFVIIVSLLWLLLLLPALKPGQALLAVLVFSQVACLIGLFGATGGSALYRDDHPSFMFRLLEFTRTFPQLVNYDPHWNGGQVGFVETSSGTTGLGLFLWPLWRFSEIHIVYTYGIAFLFILFMPLVAVYSVRIMGLSWRAGLCAGVFALGVSQHYYLWLLKYGTVGACFASCFIIPFSAGLFRVVWLGKMEKRLAVFIVLAGFFMLQWPPCAIIAICLAIGFLLSWRKWTKRKICFLAVCGAIVFALCSRTIFLLLTRGHDQMNYVLGSDEAGSISTRIWMGKEGLLRGFEHLRAHLREGNPVLVFLGLFGLFSIPYRSIRRWCIPSFVLLALCAGWGREVMPKLQLSRMAIPLLLMAVVPAAISVNRLTRIRRYGAKPLLAGLVALLLISGWYDSRAYANRGMARYSIMSPRVRAIVAWVDENTPSDGRLLFAGPAVHAYSGGHVAYLPHLAGREMIACDYYHFPSETTEYRMPPAAFQDDSASLYQYMQLYNVTQILTFHDEWKQRLEEIPEQYRLEKQWDEMSIYTVLRESSLIEGGSGTVTADFNSLEIKLDGAPEKVTLKYNWIEGMKAMPDDVGIAPVECKNDVRLIGIRPNGHSEIRLEFHGI